MQAYTMEALEQVIQDENIFFDSFDNDAAIDLFKVFFDTGRAQGLKVCCQIKLGGFVVARGFGNGTDESNLPFLERKTNSVYRSGKSSLRCGMEAELTGPEPWLADTETYAVKGGAFPIKLKDNTVVGAICVSGLFHVDDHKFAVEVLKKYQELRKGDCNENCADQ